MMKIKHFYSLLVLLFISLTSNAQEIVRGEVTNSKNGDPVVDAKVSVNGVGKILTDLDGTYSLKLAPGKYTLMFSQTLDGFLDEEREIEVIAENLLILNVKMSSSLVEVEGVTVSAQVAPPTSDKVLDEVRADEEGTTDIVGNEAMTKKGITTAANAVATTPGASVEDGKNVYIRGLGDRYTKTILNGMDIPGLDPDRNSVQLDIFPTVLVDKITVYKTFTPNLTADFTGGLIDIETKDFPTKKTIYAKIGLGYNSNATFNPDFISYKGGAIDFLGFDDGSRKLPLNPIKEILNPILGDEGTALATKSFGKTMATEKSLSFLNQNYAFAIGNQKDFYINKNSSKRDSTRMTYGYNAVVNYRTSNTYYRDVQYNEFIKDTDSTENELFRDRSSRGEQTESNVLWTALFGQSIKFGKSKFSLTFFHTQNGTKSSANLTERNYDSNQATLVKQGLQYTQRSVSNANLTGTHYLDAANKWKLIWKASPTFSRISDPDIRSTALEVSDQLGPNGEVRYIWEESVGAEVRRIFRSLNEYNVSGRFDIEHKFMQWDSLESVLSFGGLTTYKNRSFDVSEYVFRLYGISNVVPNDPNWFFQDENIWTPETNQGTYATGQQEKANIYQANQMTNAAYVMNELPFSKSISATYGARVERNVNRYTGQGNNAEYDPNAPRYINEVVLNKINVLPSVNMVYKIRNAADSGKYESKTNFRLAYTQTVARPSFREISISQIYDPIQGRRYLGNINLKQTLIHNADFRWERFFGRTEIISASAFYKRFINPIEIVANVAAPNEFLPVNAGVADIYGAEFEFRKAIGFKRKSREHIRFVLGGNFTYVVSRIDMNKVETKVGGVTMTEKEVRQANARQGEVIGNYRTMYGQSPYIINAFANFSNDSLALSCNVSYNVQGKKLAVIGVGGVPDVFEQPFHSLNLKVSKGFGKTHKGESAPRWTGSITGTNLLNQARRRWYESFNADAQVFDYLHKGMTVSAAISYTLK
jgi:TonB-dependent receptor